MNKKNKDMNKNKKDDNEYGEFIPNFFNWISLNEQKENTERFEKATKESDN